MAGSFEPPIGLDRSRSCRSDWHCLHHDHDPAGSHGIVSVRVSTAHQAEDELPVESQIAELKVAVEATGATCEVVTEVGRSQKELARQGFSADGRPPVG